MEENLHRQQDQLNHEGVFCATQFWDQTEKAVY